LLSRLKDVQEFGFKNQKHNSITDWLKKINYSRNRVICSHENNDLIIMIKM